MTESTPTTNERKEIVELFPALDLTEVFDEYSHLSNEALIQLILDKSQQIPTKVKPRGICTHLMIKVLTSTLTVITYFTNRLPKMLGGTEIRVQSLINENSNRFRSVKESLECSVCWDIKPISQICFCDPMTSSSQNSQQQHTSAETHIFCHECLQKHALVSMEEMPIAKNGLGLCCMMQGCENPITFHELAVFIAPEMIKKLQERAAEQCIVQAALNYLERCHKCNCAVELGRSPKQMQVFKCPSCKYEFCRLCDEEWQKEHEGISCDEMMRRNKGTRLLEKRLSEVVIRNCPKCKLAFVKYEGCNKVTCKCGHTQCYICRTDNITYSHFCQCFGSTRQKNNTDKFHCTKCNKNCLLYENSTPLDELQMRQIRLEEAKKETKRGKATVDNGDSKAGCSFFGRVKK